MGIVISISAGKDAGVSVVTATGSIEHIVSDAERKSFKLGGEALRNAAGKYFDKKPTNAYLKSPTPWGDLYKTYKWEQVKTVIRPVRQEIITLNANPTILKKSKLENNTKDTVTQHSVSISESVTNEASFSWQVGGDLTVGSEIEVGADFAGIGAKAKASISYTAKWGVSDTVKKAVTVGSETSVAISLNPGQKVVATLGASRGELVARITYEASLTGHLAVNYDPSYRGHHFHARDIATVMEAAGIENKITWVQEIKLDYYSDSTVSVTDVENGDFLTLRDPEGRQLAA